MIRAFTISFDFEGRTYLALASMKTAENDTVCSVRIYDDALARIIPDKNLSFSSKKPLCPTSLRHPHALRLFSCINEAVSCHLQAAEKR